MSRRTLDPGALPKAERRVRSDRHLLALSGGGYRGLFTAEVLARFEKARGGRSAGGFDMLAGTSIGGILAIGLACGVEAQHLADLVREHGPAIFRPRLAAAGGLTSCRYSTEGLKAAVEKVLTQPVARRPFADIPVPLLVVAIDEDMNRPHIFRTKAAGGDDTGISTLDVALATSAAPTYFPAREIDGRRFIDGGLVANAPDVVLLLEAVRRFGCEVRECHLLSIGTAGSTERRLIGSRSPGKIGWVARHGLVELTLASQEALAIDQAAMLRPGTFLRVDAQPASPISLDEVTDATSQALLGLAEQAVCTVSRDRSTDWRRFIANRPSSRAEA